MLPTKNVCKKCGHHHLSQPCYFNCEKIDHKARIVKSRADNDMNMMRTSMGPSSGFFYDSEGCWRLGMMMVVEGIISIYMIVMLKCFNPRATVLSIPTYEYRLMWILIIYLNWKPCRPMSVTMSTKVYKSCVLKIGDQQMLAGLIVLSIQDFDVKSLGWIDYSDIMLRSHVIKTIWLSIMQTIKTYSLLALGNRRFSVCLHDSSK